MVDIGTHDAGEAGVVLGRAVAAARRAGELEAEPEAVRQLLTGQGGAARWVLAAGFLVGMEEETGELAEVLQSAASVTGRVQRSRMKVISGRLLPPGDLVGTSDNGRD